MSSAILYGAIVVIWAAVLIPRWLRRGESASAADPEEAVVAEETVAEEPVAPRAVSDDAAERARILGARRRLLYMLLALAFGSAILAQTGLAAWWVILPPSIMLAGYLALLREASKADAERRGLQPAGETPRARRVQASGTGASRGAESPAVETPTVSVETPADPDAEVIDITGRVGEEFYDQYADAKLRAVGD
ncbi:MAG: hypothetical protein JO345_29300 [Streptosporangiaceae bacterium]|nr:hypothetical protein [Streptosporangiaceae bacterium]